MYISRLVKNFKVVAMMSLLFISNLNASEASDGKNFAVISIQKVSESCGVFQNIRSQMNERMKKLSADFDLRGQKIKSEEKKVENEKSLISNVKYSEKMNEVNKSKQEIQVALESEKQKLQKVYFDAISEVNKKMISTIETIEKKKNYHAVFELSTLVHSDLDNITEEVIAEMNKTLPNYEMKFEESNSKSKK